MKKLILTSSILLVSPLTVLIPFGTVQAQETQFIDFGAAPLPMGERPDPTQSSPAFIEEGENGIISGNGSNEEETLFEKPEPPKPRVSALYYSVARNDLVALQDACSAGCNIQEIFYKNNNILHLTAMAGNLGMYQYAWDRGAPYMANSDKETPLHLAAQSGSVELVDYILSKLKDPQKAMQALNKENQTPLFYAFKNMKARDLTGLYLLERKSDCNAQDKSGYTPMTFAMLQKNQASISQFQKYGCDFFIKDKENLTPAHMAVKQAVQPQEFQEYNKFLYSGLTVPDAEVIKEEPKIEIEEKSSAKKKR